MPSTHEHCPLPVALPDAAPCPANHPPPEHGELPKNLLRLSSRTLLGGRNEVEIDHDGAIYRLRHTALGKLILTK